MTEANDSAVEHTQYKGTVTVEVNCQTNLSGIATLSSDVLVIYQEKFLYS